MYPHAQISESAFVIFKRGASVRQYSGGIIILLFLKGFFAPPFPMLNKGDKTSSGMYVHEFRRMLHVGYTGQAYRIDDFW